MKHHRYAVALAVLGLGVAAAPAAHADVSCTVVEVEASSADTPSMDPALRPLEKKLKKPPFTSWNVFKRLGASTVSLAPQGVASASLVHGKFGLLLRDVTERPGKRARLSLGITLEDAGGKRVVDTKVNVDAGDYFVAGRPLPDNKGHLVALTCK
ncbi:MAG: hypothetical protein R3B06_05610 [Kofleriaceae bacterium]